MKMSCRATARYPAAVSLDHVNYYLQVNAAPFLIRVFRSYANMSHENVQNGDVVKGPATFRDCV